MVLTTTLVGTLGAGLLSLATIPALAGSDVEIGTRTCWTIPATSRNRLIHSCVALDCTFDTGSGKEGYRAETRVSLGPDVNRKRPETTRFTVVTAAMENDKIGGLSNLFLEGK